MPIDLTRENLVEELLAAIPGLRPVFDEISWELEMPGGTYDNYGVVGELITRRSVIPGVLGEPNEFTAAAVRFVERMIESADEEVVNVAMLSVGAPLHWNGEGIARAAFESPILSIGVKDMIRRS